ncbi:MAG TPA: phospholipase D-like domain-containing protein [Candidatus Saccharimonadales bacterium]|nr:phospholipase D-like domain-containing protein [Candidatus Saccharimonadales bacterium]
MSTRTKSPTFAIIDSDAYLPKLIKSIEKAKDRVVVASMILLWGKETEAAFDALKDALVRGVEVTLLLDRYTKLPRLYGLSPDIPPKKRVQQTFQLLKELEDSGATVHYYGRIGLVPYKGRCHVKITVIDDEVFSFGGLNFYDEQFENADYMLHVTNKTIAGQLCDIVDDIGAYPPPLPNLEIDLSAGYSILFDGGIAANSIIYERACELGATAKRVYYVSQMPPSGELGDILRETDSTCYFNRPAQMVRPSNWSQAYDQQKHRITNHYDRPGFLHAKFMLFELPGGRKTLLSGSNNFSYRGVAFGTQEIALYSTDIALWSKLHAFLGQRIR